MWYYLYVLYDDSREIFYIGRTTNLKRRLLEHKRGKNHTTKRFKKIELVFAESFRHKVDVARRERYFKTTKGKRALRLMLRAYLAEL